MIRTLLIGFLLSLYVVLVGPPLLLYSLLTKDVDLLYQAALRGVLFCVYLAGVRIHVDGRANIPSGACLFVANHTSAADPPAVVGAIPRRIAIIAKESLFRIPIVGQTFRLAKFVPVNRSDHDSAVASVEKGIEHLRSGQSFVIYPEGTRSPDGRLQKFKKGAFVMAIKAGVPIVPVACAGAHRIMKKHSLVIHPGDIYVRFMPPVDASAYTFEQRDELATVVQRALAAGLPYDQQPLWPE